ncbi:hypothetical protein K3495_g6486 [Podosphaera aphanis]|nr:hypothetical protein K3495_g6486 [Podosphaera aphanis]
MADAADKLAIETWPEPGSPVAVRDALSYFATEQTATCSQLLRRRQAITDDLACSPYDLILYLVRASLHAELGYPDLAVGDSYRALLLCDECTSDAGEYHDAARAALAARHRSAPSADVAARVAPARLDGHPDAPTLRQTADSASLRCYRNLAIGLRLCGCLQSAREWTSRGLALAPADPELIQAQQDLATSARAVLHTDMLPPTLPDQGHVRREVYPWNDHEPDRFAGSTLDFLNRQLATVAPKCQVRVTELPRLTPSEPGAERPMNRQLGLFATADIQPGERVLTELSLLAVNNRLKGSLCDACSAELPPLSAAGAAGAARSCPDCDDIFFCTAACEQRAQVEYHPAICGKDVDTIAKDPAPAEKPAALYYLLLARCLAMATAQACHPLDLTAITYLWGDFHPVPAPTFTPTLPFSFKYHVTEPLHLLEKMDRDIFVGMPDCDLWIVNTLYAKFRGTASARVEPTSGHPEVAAVHPLWCLANHDCDPNVQWEWEGRMELTCRPQRINHVARAIRADEEILSHYCDIDLPVRERREWAKGSLGGWCQCKRCCREDAEEGAREIREN